MGTACSVCECESKQELRSLDTSSYDSPTIEFPLPSTDRSYKSTVQKPPREKREKSYMPDGSIYEGEWSGKFRDGYGTLYWDDSSKYEGEWKDDKASGKGKYFYANGETYEGQFSSNKANGYGRFGANDGTKYEGQWRDNIQEGYGIEIWPDGSRYEGYYKNGKKEGQGTYVWANGTSYIGNWVANKCFGHGTLLNHDGRKYEGAWHNNLPHGEGAYRWPDGTRYKGEFYEGKMHGYGTYIWSDRTTLEISWNFGKPHGKGKLSYGGISCHGVWNNGKRVKWGLQADPGVATEDGENGEEELDFKETLFDLEEPHSINFNNYNMRLSKKKPDRKKDEHVKELLMEYQKGKSRRSDPAKKANLKTNSPLMPKKFLSNEH